MRRLIIKVFESCCEAIVLFGTIGGVLYGYNVGTMVSLAPGYDYAPVYSAVLFGILFFLASCFLAGAGLFLATIAKNTTQLVEMQRKSVGAAGQTA